MGWGENRKRAAPPKERGFGQILTPVPGHGPNLGYKTSACYLAGTDPSDPLRLHGAYFGVRG